MLVVDDSPNATHDERWPSGCGVKSSPVIEVTFNNGVSSLGMRPPQQGG